jgi:hypothetical protein
VCGPLYEADDPFELIGCGIGCLESLDEDFHLDVTGSQE